MDDFVSYPTNIEFDNGDFTVSGWFKREGVAGGSEDNFTIFSQRVDAAGDGNPAVILYGRAGGGAAGAQIRDNAGAVVQVFGTTNIQDGQWYHVAITKTATVLKIYVNGVMENSTPHTLTGDFDTGSVHRLIGKHAWGGVDRSFSNGLIDDVRVYNRALTDADVSTLYGGSGSGGGGSCTDPEGDEGTIVFNTTYRTLQFCNGTVWVGMGGQVAADDASEGAPVWIDVELTDTDPFVGMCKYRFQIGTAWYYANTIHPDYLLFDVSTASWKYGAIEKATKNQYWYRNEADVSVTSGTPAAVSAMQKQCMFDNAPDSFVFTDVTNAPVGTMITSNIVTVSGIASALGVNVSGGGYPQFSIDGGPWTTSSTIQNGQTLQLRLSSSAYGSTTHSASLSVGTFQSAWNVTTVAVADTTPDAFSFTDQTGVAVSTLTTSNSVTINGIAAAANVSVSGDGSPEIRINGGSWVTSGTINNGETLEVRLTSAAANSTAYTAVVNVGGVTDNWSVTTVAPDTTPDAFGFTDQTDVAVSTLITSNSVTVNGINVSTPVSVTGAGAQISINGGAWGTSGNITNGQSLQVRLTSSASFSTASTATVDVGGVTDVWSVTTIAADTTPDVFSFNDQTDVAVSTLISSNSIPITGINTDTAVSVSGDGSPQISIDGGPWATSGTIQDGQTLQVRLTSAAANSTAYTATVDVGGVTDNWSVTTEAPAVDTTPDAFDFTDQTDVATSTLTTSNSITINGINADTSVSVSGDGSPQISINGGAWATSGSITNGQSLQVRLTSSATNSDAYSVTVSVGGVTDDWSVTTVAGAAISCPALVQFLSCYSSSTINLGALTSAAACQAACSSQTSQGCCEWYSQGATKSCTFFVNSNQVGTDGSSYMQYFHAAVCATADTTPDAFSFTDQTDVAVSTLTTSNSITINGINASTPVSVTGTGAQISINGGAWGTSGSITNGQSLQVRLTSSASFSTALSATVDVGGVTDSWSVTTRAANNCTSTTINWSPGCSASSGTMTHSQNKSVSNSASGYTGTRDLTCNDGTISQSGGSCAASGDNCTPMSYGRGCDGDSVQVFGNSGYTVSTCQAACNGVSGGTCCWFWPATGACVKYQGPWLNITHSQAYTAPCN
ncbi:MAG: hypothetical protein LRZ85_09190 [Alphaproteobacteria bacterium]|nr:hypothetical protein [Alphaproteobacteria bacterium]